MEELLPLGSFWWLLESAPDGIVIVDSAGGVMLVNAQAERMFGYLEDELLGKPVETLIPEHFREKHSTHRANYSAMPQTRPMGTGLELRGQRKDGSEFPVEISLSPVYTKAGLLVMAIIRDVTDYKRQRFISETLQKAMLSSVPDTLDGVEIASAYHSAYMGARVGGDFFDVFDIDSGLVGIAIGDVSGKGVEASVHTALAKYSLRAYAYTDPTPSSVIKRLNNAVYRQGKPDDFITGIYGILEVATGTLSFANAGHMSPLYLPQSSREVMEVQGTGLPLGVEPDTIYEQHTLKMNSGDRLLLYSDGVTDAWGGRDFYGLDNLIEFFSSAGQEQPNEFVDHLVKTLEEWSGERLRDDITLLLISMK